MKKFFEKIQQKLTKRMVNPFKLLIAEMIRYQILPFINVDYVITVAKTTKTTTTKTTTTTTKTTTTTTIIIRKNDNSEIKSNKHIDNEIH